MASLIFDLVDYSVALAPIALAHFVVPPLSFIAGREYPPNGIVELMEQLSLHLVPIEWRSKYFIRSLLLRINSWQQDNPAAWVSHLFIHSSYSHLLGNLSTLFTSGFTIYNSFGAYGLYSSFLAGGMCAALPSYLHTLDGTKGLRELDRKVETITKNWYFGGFFNSVISTGTSIIHNTLSGDVKACGSSGAICAMMGLSSVLTFDSIWSDVCKYRNNKSNLMSVVMVQRVIQLASFAAYIINEYVELNYVTDDKNFIDIFFGQRISHAAHFQGAIIGMTLGVASLLWKYSKNKSRTRTIINM